MPLNCLSKFQFCTRSSKPINPDYECLPYETEPQAETNTKLPTPIKVQIDLNLTKLDKLNNLKKQNAKRNLFNYTIQDEVPNFQSTKNDQSTLSGFHQLEYSKITSTILQKTNLSPESLIPDLSNIDEESSKEVTTGSSFASTQYLTASSCNSENFKSVNPSFFDKSVQGDLQPNVIYVCSRSYSARFQGDVDLQYSERVNVLHANEDFAFVKKLRSLDCGYAPSSCLVKLDDFLKSF